MQSIVDFRVLSLNILFYEEYFYAVGQLVGYYISLSKAKEKTHSLAIFVETDPDLYLPNLSEYITFKKEEEINVIDISDCTEILSAMKDRIKNVEVYYNPYTTKLVSAIEEAKIYNIVTQKEV